MKINKFFRKWLAVVFTAVLLFNITMEAKKNENEQGSQTKQTKSLVSQAQPFDILFGTLWPFEEGTASWETSRDKTILTLNGSSTNILGVVCWERKISLRGNRTLEIEILDLGNSSFRSEKMLKVFIWNEPKGDEVPLKCTEEMKQSDDPEFVLPVTGIFRYSLNATKDDTVHKLAFVFYNAKLEGFKLKARFVK